jgi:hypothetical protein
MKRKQALLGSNLPGLIQSDSMRNVVDNFISRISFYQ